MQLVSPLADTATAGTPEDTAASFGEAGERGAGVAFVERSCPTFSWAAVEGAVGYEVRIIDLESATESDEAVVASATLPAGALSWTPAGNRCLARGVLYGWAARGLFGEVAAGGRWSPVAPFRIEVEVSPETVRAVAVALASEAQGDSAARGVEKRHGAVVEGGAFGEGAALRGEALATSGDAAGAVGTSASAAGAGVGAANAGNGADLLLDGVADGVASTYLRHDWLDRPDVNDQSFAFTNSGGGGFELRVLGQKVWTSANDGAGSGFNADRLLARSSAELASTGHNHDSSHYTETELATDTAATVHWTHLIPLPAAWADGDQTRLDSRFGTTQVNSGSAVTAIAATRGHDGLPVVAVKLANSTGRLIFCEDLACSTSTVVGLTGPSGSGDRISVLPSNPDVPGSVLVAAETGVANTSLQLCDRTACVISRTLPLLNPVMIPGPAGFPLIFGVSNPGGVVVTRVTCTTWACSSEALWPGNIDLETENSFLAAVVFPNSNPMVAFRHNPLDRIRFHYCNDQCGGIHPSSFEQGTTVGSGKWPVLAIAQNGGLLLADRLDSGAVRFTNCESYSCLGGTSWEFANSTSPSVALGRDGSGLLSFVTADTLMFGRCADPGCANFQTAPVTTASDDLAVMQIGADGLPFFAVADGGNLRLVHCANAACRQNGAN